MVIARRRIDTGWHPLASGVAPAWVDGWGQDEHGVFVEVVIDEAELRLRWIPPGRFWMGSPESEPGRQDEEGPRVEVTFAEGFWLMDAPVTQALWQAVMGVDSNPSRFVSPDRPVEQVNWDDARRFIEAINARVSGLGLRLPSEAEWEYACRARTEMATYAGAIEIVGERNAPVLEEIAWYGGNSGVSWDLEEGVDASGRSEKAHEFSKTGTRPVRLKRPNGWGCYDMLGNVWEWCADEWHDGHEGAPPDGAPRQASAASSYSEQRRVIRGGSWSDPARDVRSAMRDMYGSAARFGDLGFRCVRDQVVSSGGPEGRGPWPVEGGEAEPPPEPGEGGRAERGPKFSGSAS